MMTLRRLAPLINISLDIISMIQINLMCNCGADIETTIHYLLCCHLYSDQQGELHHGVSKSDCTLQNSSEDQLLTVLLYGSEKFALSVNKEIITDN